MKQPCKTRLLPLLMAIGTKIPVLTLNGWTLVIISKVLSLLALFLPLKGSGKSSLFHPPTPQSKDVSQYLVIYSVVIQVFQERS